MSVVVTVVLVVTLTPLLGVLGAVLALVLSELTLVLTQLLPTWDFLDHGDLLRNTLWVLGAGGVGTAAHFWLVALGAPWLAVAVPVALYAALLLASREPSKLLVVLRERR